MTSDSGIQYPYARNGGRIVHVDEAEHGHRHTCILCGDDMTAVQGEIREWHFRHIGAGECDPYERLHETAQYLIVQHFQDAQRDETPWWIANKCTRCHRVLLEENAATPEATITTEDSHIIPGTRPDVVIRHESNARILEIVVTHRPSENTREKFEESGTPVFIKEFSNAQDLDQLRTGFEAEEAINLTGKCPECLEEAAEELLAEELLAEMMLGQKGQAPPTTRTARQREPDDQITSWEITTFWRERWDVDPDDLPDDAWIELIGQGIPMENLRGTNCDNCGNLAILNHEFVQWTPAGNRRYSVIHKNCEIPFWN